MLPGLSHRLLILSTEFPPGPGGIGTHAHQLAQYLNQRGWQIHVLAPQYYISDADRQAFNQGLTFPITSLARRGYYPVQIGRRLAQIMKAFRQTMPDVMIATGRRALWLAALLAPVVQKPWLAVGHGSEFIDPGGYGRYLTRLAVQQANIVVAVSQYTADLIKQTGQPQKIVVIPNGANSERFRPGLDTALLRQRLALDGKKVLLTVGNLTERKAQDVVIRALPAIISQYPDVVYVMVGLPTQQERLARLADVLGMTDHVRFAGMVADADIPDYYNLCDLFVLVSRRTTAGHVEGYGIVVLEAALCGKTAVVSQGCGLQETVKAGETGLIVPPDDVEATAQAIISLLQDEERRKQMEQQAQQWACRATWSHRAAEYDQLLHEMLGNQ